MVISWKNRQCSEEKCLILFLMLGIFTSFFDFLTYPITTFALPYILGTVLLWKDDKKRQINRLFTSGVIWCIGYVGMWSMKWVLASCFTGENVIESALNSIETRTSSVDSPIVVSIIRNIGAFVINPFTLVTGVVIVLIFIKYKIELNIKRDFIYVITMILPIIWYCFASNHSYHHFWFTFRNMIISVFSIFALLQNNIGKMEINNE